MTNAARWFCVYYSVSRTFIKDVTTTKRTTTKKIRKKKFKWDPLWFALLIPPISALLTQLQGGWLN